jgi:hypothetical protein
MAGCRVKAIRWKRRRSCAYGLPTRDRRTPVADLVAELKSEMALAELRQARERSQEELARTLKVKQPAVAKLEKRAGLCVSNLRGYIEALGGSLEITARFRKGAPPSPTSATSARLLQSGSGARRQRDDPDCMERSHERI